MPKPKKGESKQAFITRCVQKIKASGTQEKKALSTCAGLWNQQLANADNDSAYLSASIKVLLNDAPHADGTPTTPPRFGILAYSGAVIDLGWWRFVIDIKGMKAKEAFPALREHARDRIVGTCTAWKTDANGMHVVGDFSQATEDAREVLALAQEGYPWQASIGVSALATEQLEIGQKRKINGQLLEGPLEIWTESLVSEVSFVSLGADDNTAAIIMSRTNVMENTEMNEELRKLLVNLGMPADASDEDAMAFLKAHNAQAKQNTSDDNTVVTGVAATNMGVQVDAPLAMPEAQAQQHASDALLQRERERIADITALYRKLHLPSDDCDELIKSGATIHEARQKALEVLAKRQPQVGLNFGADESDKFRQHAADAMLLRAGYSGNQKRNSSEHNEFRAMSLVDLARYSLERGGHSCRGLSATEVAEKILSRSVALSASVSDFRSIFMEVAHKRLLDAYAETPQTWRPLVSIVAATDFKEIHGVSLSEAPDLELVTEHGEYKTGNLKDKQECYSIAKYGRILGLTREMIINDDMRAFARIPQLLGAAAGRKASDIVWGLLLANPTMRDGKPLFDASRKNIATTKTHVTSEALSQGRTAMRTQRGSNGALLDITPAFVVVPVAQETSAEVLLRSIALPDDNKSSGVHNPWAGRLTPIAEPRLDSNSTDAWYLVASPSQVDTIEVAFLNGNEQPDIIEEEQFRTDGIYYKARLEMGAGVMDSIGFYKNLGK